MINKKDEIIRKIYFTDNLLTHSTFNCFKKNGINGVRHK